MHREIHAIALLIIVVFFSDCGRKQRNVFQFPAKEAPKINKLSFPAVRGLTAVQEKDGSIKLTWLAIHIADVNLHKYPNTQLVGYHVFRLVKGHFVPKQPITKQPLTQTVFIDHFSKKHTQHHCYMIRPIFKIDDQIVQGPASQVVCSRRA